MKRQPNRRYRLGMRSLALASVVLETSPLLANALPLMRSLNDQLDLNAALAVWERGGVLWLQPGVRSVARPLPARDRIAAGTVLLAGRPEAEIEAASDVARAPVTIGRREFA